MHLFCCSGEAMLGGVAMASHLLHASHEAFGGGSQARYGGSGCLAVARYPFPVAAWPLLAGVLTLLSTCHSAGNIVGNCCLSATSVDFPHLVKCWKLHSLSYLAVCGQLEGIFLLPYRQGKCDLAELKRVA